MSEERDEMGDQRAVDNNSRQDPFKNAFIRSVPLIDEYGAGVFKQAGWRVLNLDERRQTDALVRLNSTSTEPLGFSPETAFAETGPQRVFYFLGQPMCVARSISQEQAICIWRVLLGSLLRPLAVPPRFLRANAETSEFGRPLFELIGLLVPFRRAHVFETNCEGGAHFVYKYALEFASSGVEITPQSGTSTFSRVKRQENRSLVFDGSISEGVSLRAFHAGRIAEIMKYKAGPTISFRTLGLLDNQYYFTLVLSAVDTDIVILTDTREDGAFRALQSELLSDLLATTSQHLLNRFLYLRSADAVRSQVRHALHQANDQSRGLVAQMLENWHDLEDAPGIGKDHVAILKLLAEQVFFTERRIEEVGRNPLDAFGLVGDIKSIRANQSVFTGSTDDFELVDLVEEIRRTLMSLNDPERIRVEQHSKNTVRRVRTDKGAFRACLTELINNALKYSPQDYCPKILVSDYGGKKGISVTITNIGPHIGKEEWQHLLDFGIRGRQAIKQGIRGSGGGLAMVRDTAAELGLEFSFIPVSKRKRTDKSVVQAKLLFPAKLIE